MNREAKQKLCIAWLAINLALMWGNSLLPGDISGAISDWVKDLVASALHQASIPGVPGGGLIRKTAHFLEFMSLGLALCWLGDLTAKKTWQRRVSPLFGLAAACVDESIQLFVPGRHGCVTDVLIDTAGVAVGTLLYLAVKKIRQTKNTHIMEELK